MSIKLNYFWYIREYLRECVWPNGMNQTRDDSRDDGDT